MSTTWQDLRTGVVVKDLATTDTDIEATQAVYSGTGAPVFQSPSVWRGGSSEIITRIAVMVLAYNGGGAIVSGNCTIQLIEESPDPTVVPAAVTGRIYAGRAPVTSHPYGRVKEFDARYLHRFTVRLSSASAGTKLRVLWRPFDSTR